MKGKLHIVESFSFPELSPPKITACREFKDPLTLKKYLKDKISNDVIDYADLNDEMMAPPLTLTQLNIRCII